MILKFYKPKTPSQRSLIKCFLENLNKTPLLKSKLKGVKNSSGRNNQGKITSYHKGGGHKKRYRTISFNKIFLVKGIVTSIEYDPNRTSYIISIFDLKEKQYFYALAPLNIKIGNIIQYGLNAKIKLGNKLPVIEIPLGCFIHNISYGNTLNYSRSAGTFSILLKKTLDFGIIRLSSGELKKIPLDSYANIGLVSNSGHFLETTGKAGRSRWLNKRPTVRGVAMNPIDHPHGGGEGKTSGGRPSVTPWGKPTRNILTKRSKKKNG